MKVGKSERLKSQGIKGNDSTTDMLSTLSISWRRRDKYLKEAVSANS